MWLVCGWHLAAMWLAYVWLKGWHAADMIEMIDVIDMNIARLPNFVSTNVREMGVAFNCIFDVQ